MTLHRWWLMGALALNTIAVADEPVADAATRARSRIVVDGFAQPLTLDAAMFAAMPRVEREAANHGSPARWSGVALVEVLRRAGAPLGQALRGDAIDDVVVVHAADGYVASFALAEFDAAFGDLDVLLVDRRDGKALADDEGPWRLVVPDEQRAARWVRQVTRIELRSMRLE